MIYLPGVFIMALLALIFLIIALILIIGKKIEILHTYHWKNIKEEDKNSYAIKMGIGMFVSFLANISGAFVNFFTKSNWGWLSFGIGLTISLILWFLVQKKYNGGMF